MLDLTPIQTRQKVEQVKAYFSAIKIPTNPLHKAVKDAKGCGLGQGKSWMGQASATGSKYASWQSSSKPRSGKGTQTDSGVSTKHSFLNTWESTVENGR